MTRYRKSIVHEVSSQKNRIEKFLQGCGFKLSTFMSDVFGASGKLVLNHLIQHGKISVKELDPLIKGVMRKKKEDIALAVNGNMSAHERNFLSIQMRHLAQMEKNIEELELIKDMIEDYIYLSREEQTEIRGEVYLKRILNIRKEMGDTEEEAKKRFVEGYELAKGIESLDAEKRELLFNELKEKGIDFNLNRKDEIEEIEIAIKLRSV